MSGGHKIPNRMPSKFSAPHMREGLRKKRLTSLPSQRLHPSPASGVVPTAASLARRHGSNDVTQSDRKIWVIWSQRRQPRARIWTRRSSSRGCSETEQARMNGKRGRLSASYVLSVACTLARQSCTNSLCPVLLRCRSVIRSNSPARVKHTSAVRSGPLSTRRMDCGGDVVAEEICFGVVAVRREAGPALLAEGTRSGCRLTVSPGARDTMSVPPQNLEFRSHCGGPVEAEHEFPPLGLVRMSPRFDVEVLEPLLLVVGALI